MQIQYRMCDILACAKMQVFTFLVYLTIIASFAASIVSNQLIPVPPCQMVHERPCENDPDFPRLQVKRDGGASDGNFDACRS
jgi:hypothetical protein